MNISGIRWTTGTCFCLIRALGNHSTMANHSLTSRRCTHCDENHIYVFLFWELRGLVPIFTFMCLWAIYIFRQIGPHISCSRIRRPILEIYINLSQIYECGSWETEHYNPGLEIIGSFLGIHKWEPDIYIGFSSALHLKCGRFLYSIINFSSIHLVVFFILKVHSKLYFES